MLSSYRIDELEAVRSSCCAVQMPRVLCCGLQGLALVCTLREMSVGFVLMFGCWVFFRKSVQVEKLGSTK